MLLKRTCLIPKEVDLSLSLFFLSARPESYSEGSFRVFWRSLRSTFNEPSTPGCGVQGDADFRLVTAVAAAVWRMGEVGLEVERRWNMWNLVVKQRNRDGSGL